MLVKNIKISVIIFLHSFNWHNIAAPFSVQYLGCSLVGKSTATIKLVDYPVVDKTPALTDVLYTGQLYSSGSGL